MSALARALSAALLAAAPGFAAALEIVVQSRHPPLQFEGAAPGGAHPIGGPSKRFVDLANERLAPLDIRFRLRLSGQPHAVDAADAAPPAVDLAEWGTLHRAVAEGALDAALGIPADSGLAFGEFYSGGVPFGLTAEQFIAFLYQGGGLALQQELYDEAFGGGLVVLPVAVAGPQGSGFFRSPIGDPETEPGLDAQTALAEFCARPIVLRYPEGGQAVLAEACARAGGGVDSIGRGTRCEDPRRACGPDHPDNPVAFEPVRLTFGGFAPGVAPHMMYANGNIDAFELNAPIGHVQFLKLAAGVADRPDAEVDLSAVAPPYHYGTAWHQPWLYAELVINRALWDGLTEAERAAIDLAARAATLENFAIRMSVQGAALETLRRAGVAHLRWPDPVLALLREAAPAGIDALADGKAAAGDDTLRRAVAAMRAYRAENLAYFEFADVTRGESSTPSAP